MKGKNDDNNPRRQFISTIASGAATMGLSTIISPLTIHAENNFLHGEENPEQWFNQIKGKHRIVFDSSGSN